MKLECRLRVIFAERNIKQKDFAEEIKISQGALSQLARGRTVPTLEVAYRIAKALDLNVMEIWVAVDE